MRGELAVTEVQPLIDYVLSMRTAHDANEDRKRELRRIVEERMALGGGAIRIGVESGLFIAKSK